jgi:hypothetical protein
MLFDRIYLEFLPFFHQWKISGKSVEFPLSTTPYRGGSGKILPPSGRTKNGGSGFDDAARLLPI